MGRWEVQVSRGESVVGAEVPWPTQSGQGSRSVHSARWHFVEYASTLRLSNIEELRGHISCLIKRRLC